jgi:thiamine biosynthesis protein ThiS
MSGKPGTIIANGENRQIELPCTMEKFLNLSGWRSTQVVVEHNGNVVARRAVGNIQLKDGDRLEVIVPVAGG